LCSAPCRPAESIFRCSHGSSRLLYQQPSAPTRGSSNTRPERRHTADTRPTRSSATDEQPCTRVRRSQQLPIAAVERHGAAHANQRAALST
jgi:hypothetical protein